MQSKSLDPVSAYELLAPSFPTLAQSRRAYLDSVDRFTASLIPAGAKTLLDIGGGDGSRASRIASRRRLKHVTLIEPSAAMRSRTVSSVEIWPICVEAIDKAHLERRFDVILCQWNVLGHITTENARGKLLRNIAQMLNASGFAFLDVSHRYNAVHYGIFRTVARALWDCLLRRETNGDVSVEWSVGAQRLQTFGHVFTAREVEELVEAAGLRVQARIAIDYRSGAVRKSIYAGHLLYVLCHRSAIASSSAPPTSSI